MAGIVKCEICGGMYNQRHLRSHKRLSHGKGGISVRSPKSELETLETIVSMYAQLSDKSKKEVRIRLSLGGGKGT
jgi:hypothetical protein